MSWWQAKGPKVEYEALASFVRTRVKAFAAYLDREDVGSQILDVKELPYPKEEILKAVGMLLASGTLRFDNQERLFQDGLLLANFQPEIGEHPVFPFGIDPNEIDLEGMTAEKLARINPAGNARFERLRPDVRADAAKIGTQLRKALDLGRGRVLDPLPYAKSNKGPS